VGRVAGVCYGRRAEACLWSLVLIARRRRRICECVGGCTRVRNQSSGGRRFTEGKTADDLLKERPPASAPASTLCHYHKRLLGQRCKRLHPQATSLSTISKSPSHFISYSLPMSRPRHLDPLRLQTLTSAPRPPSLQYLLPSSLLHLKHSAFTPSVTTSMFHFAQLCSVCCPRLDSPWSLDP
jgi:hypothetical protein